MRPKQFAVYLNGNMAGPNGLTSIPFTVGEEKHRQNLIEAIHNM